MLGLAMACNPSTQASHEEKNSSSKVISSFHNLGSTPQAISFQNDLPVNNDGGHIQGIQPYSYKGDEYVIVTGSSSTESYYAVLQNGEEKKVISVNTILEKPFKHAGGFQIHQNLMAIGIEDNEARNVSKVYIYQIDDPYHLPEKPKKIIERAGEYERATAGAIGITIYQDQLLVMAGDWSSRHLDIYTCPLNTWENDQTQFEQVASVTAADIPKDNWVNPDWVDPEWLAYQNINLINWQDTLFMVGLGANQKGEDVADLFQIEETDLQDFHFKKIASQKFEHTEETSFRWAAGISWNTENGIESIISSTAHIEETFLVHEYNSEDLLK